MKTKSQASYINQYLSEQKSLIGNHLDSLIEKGDFPQKKLFEAARYALLAGGKRLRPILTLATVELFSQNIQKALNPACAIELIHTYSLIHDDLPSTDDDDLRRGKPTLHKKYTEGLAILTGDYLLTYAFEVIANAPDLTDSQKIDLTRVLANRAGAMGMVGGQSLDIEKNKKEDLETIEWIHNHKTTALILASIEFGAIIAGASKQQFEALQSFGQNIGLAFQIVDDILDITSTQSQLGKPTLSDIENDRSTYVSLLGLEQSQKKAEELLSKALSALNSISKEDTPLHNIAKFIVQRES